MKKLAIIAILATMAAAASATDIGVRADRNTSTGADALGVTVGQSFGAFGAEAAYDRSTVGSVNVNRFSVIGSYDVAKLIGATVAAKAGVAFIDPATGKTGYAVTVGAGASYPVAKNIKLVADYSYQKDQARLHAFNGNLVSVGAKYSF